MKCLLCPKETKNINRKYCSRSCAEKAKFGRKRPDVILRNKTNNPVWDKITLEKMRQSLTGRKQSDETKLKRSRKLKQYYATHPEAKARLAKNVWDKYTSKIAGTAWNKVSKKIRERDNFTCQECNIKAGRLVVHHIDWRGKRRGISEKEMNNDPDNLITLCIKCHNNIHRHKSKDYKDRYNAMVMP